MTFEVDPYRFESRLSRRIVNSWIDGEPEYEPVWTPLSKPLSEARVALLSSGGIALKGDRPFDQEGERDNPWWGDPSFRTLPAGTTAKDVEIYHLHINPEHANRDLNVMLPLERLAELRDAGEIDAVAETHYATMGYVLDAEELLTETAPAIARQLQAEEVDILVLAPV